LAADTPLVAEQRTPLEVNHSIFLLGMAHQADLTMSLRLLDTGTASDVSGVIRMTARESEENEWASKLEDRELLYFVGQDSGVRVFERGQ
jgi:elongator complex protein 6